MGHSLQFRPTNINRFFLPNNLVSYSVILSKNETNSISPLSKCKCVILSSDNECNWITKTSQFWRHANHQEVWNFSDIEFSKQCLLQSCKYVLYCTYCHLDYQNESILQTIKKSRTSWILKLQNNVSLLSYVLYCTNVLSFGKLLSNFQISI